MPNFWKSKDMRLWPVLLLTGCGGVPTPPLPPVPMIQPQSRMTIIEPVPPATNRLIYISWWQSMPGQVGFTGLVSCTNLAAPVWRVEVQWQITGMSNEWVTTNDCPAKYFRAFNNQISL